MDDPIIVGWFCKHGHCSGSIELPGGVSRSLAEVRERVNESHAAKCKMGGHPWVLCDLERDGGMCVASESVFTIGFITPADPPPLFVVLHVQWLGRSMTPGIKPMAAERSARAKRSGPPPAQRLRLRSPAPAAGRQSSAESRNPHRTERTESK
jgi:hypothetical protein